MQNTVLVLRVDFGKPRQSNMLLKSFVENFLFRFRLPTWYEQGTGHRANIVGIAHEMNWNVEAGRQVRSDPRDIIVEYGSRNKYFPENDSIARALYN